jgi:cytochrome c peroxidase
LACLDAVARERPWTVDEIQQHRDTESGRAGHRCGFSRRDEVADLPNGNVNPSGSASRGAFRSPESMDNAAMAWPRTRGDGGAHGTWGIHVLAFLLATGLQGVAWAQLLEITPAERDAIVRHGPWPPTAPRDPSNRVSGNRAAIELGRALFFDPRLSPSGAVSCARCHQPGKAWTDGRRTPVGAVPASGRDALTRNTPTLWNAGLSRWFGWGGGSDTIWSFSLRPIRHPLEMASSAAHVARTLRSDLELACRYRRVFGAPNQAHAAVLVNVTKAIAAFVETLISARTPFDAFRDALARGDKPAAARYPLAAQRGLRIFVSKGNCSICHFGPTFTNGEFGDVGVPFFVPGGGVDGGRYAGIERLRADPYNLLGAYSDDPWGASASKTRHVVLQPRNFGEFKVPGLRNVAQTAPYMHDGSLATLDDVVKHYSELNEDRLHTDGERILRPLKLTPQASADLVAFLETLSDEGRYVAAARVSDATSRCASPRAQ